MCLTHNFWSFFVSGLSNGLIYALIALGYTLVYGVLQLINFAHSEVFMLGGFGSLFVLNKLISGTPHGAASVGYVLVGLTAGGIVGGGVAFLLERIAYRPLRRRRAPKLAYLISAIGASFFLFTMAGKEFGRDSVDVKAPFTNGNVFTLFGAHVQTSRFALGGQQIGQFAKSDELEGALERRHPNSVYDIGPRRGDRYEWRHPLERRRGTRSPRR